MAFMPFPCNGLLLFCVNLPKVLLMFFNKFASSSIPYFNIYGGESSRILNSEFETVQGSVVVVEVVVVIVLFTVILSKDTFMMITVLIGVHVYQH